MREKFDPQWSTSTIGHHVTVTKLIFNWAYNNELLEIPIRYGSNFKKPSSKRKRLERAERPAKEFSKSEIHQFLAIDDAELRAWILLGVNCGFGNSDLSRLKVDEIQGQWFETIRGKTGLSRKAWLWPETRKALKAVLANHAGGKMLFLTPEENTLVSDDGKRDYVTRKFGRIKKGSGVKRPGVGFYAFRHVCETIGGNINDQVAVDHIMGHADESMAAVYRERVFDARIKKVCQHVREWLFGDEV